MHYSFKAYGHNNITSTHKNTLEITKHKDIGKEADCIIGVKADHSLEKIKELSSDADKLKMVLEADGVREEVEFVVNKEFSDEEEIVIRISDFLSKRTLGIRCDKASIDFSKEFVEKLKNPDQEINVIISTN